MKFTFNKVGSIDNAIINVEDNKMNVKYGLNGIGKSTIAKGLIYKYDIDRRQELANIITSLKTNDEPSISSDDDSKFDSIFVYDRSYFDRLFKSVDLLNNTFELVIHDDRYDELVEPINNSLNGFEKLKTASIKLFELYSKIGEKKALDYDSKNKLKVRSSIFVNFADSGILINTNIPNNLNDYSPFVNSTFRTEWFSWVEKAKIEWYGQNNRCPFCGRQHGSGELANQINALESLCTSKICSLNDKEHSLIKDIASYLSGEKKNDVLAVDTIDGKATKEILEPVQEAIDFLKTEINKISYIISLSGQQFVNLKQTKTIKDIKNDLESNKLSTDLVLLDDSGNNVVSSVNTEIDSLISNLNSLQSHIGILETNIKTKVRDNDKLINDFLKVAGIPYCVKTEGEGESLFNSLFKYKNNPNVISNQLNYLSYGEANALALLLFCIEARTKDKTLIILDDPVSSFDSNKRYAIYNYILNSNQNLLYKKTSIMLTHEFETIIALSKSNPICNQGIVCFDYLERSGDKLVEKPFTQNDVVNTINEYRKIAQNAARPKISRVVAARHIYEIEEGTLCEEYNILSGLVHKDSKPYTDSTKTAVFSDTVIDEVGNNSLKKIFEDEEYSYSSYFEEINNMKEMISKYESTDSKFDKLCICRCLMQKRSSGEIEDIVTWNFLCEVFHVERNTIYSIKGYEIMDVPNYIIDMCDSIIRTFNEH